MSVMAECNQVLKEQNKPYPRTCAQCRLGPCRERPSAAEAIAEIERLTETLRLIAVQPDPEPQLKDDGTVSHRKQHHAWRQLAQLMRTAAAQAVNHKGSR
jgi:hypothetical protein